eukprot:GHVT01102254.1.p1 GENE.GHVT01102254.1~~GHVT01102254.1.p1  ORF type:complete len:119 (+),score=12.91 GHVT01102254.1:828-1184(+)
MGFVFGFGVSFGVPGVALVSAFSILVQVPCNKEESTSSGLIVAGREAAENPTQGRVLAVGPGAFDRHNQRVPMEVETKRICSEISASRERKRTRWPSGRTPANDPRAALVTDEPRGRW